MRLRTALLLLFFFIPFIVQAAGFQVTSIGGLNVTGTQSNEWWYTTANPTISGQTTAGSTVDVTVDGAAQTVTADGAGNWSASTTAAEGDHSVSLVSNGSTISFTLHITSTIPDTVTAPQASDVPVSGTSWPTVVLLSAGTVLFISGGLIRKFSSH